MIGHLKWQNGRPIEGPRCIYLHSRWDAGKFDGLVYRSGVASGNDATIFAYVAAAKRASSPLS